MVESVPEQRGVGVQVHGALNVVSQVDGGRGGG